MSELDVLVVGGGISGLAVAHCLARSGLTVELWEGADRVGGKIRSVRKNGFCLDGAASMVMNYRSEVDRFLHSAGLTSSKLSRTPGSRRYVLDADRLHEVPSGIGDLFKSPLFSSAGKLRLLAEPLIARGNKPHESVAEFVSRRLGREFLDKVFEPYLAGPLASNADHAEAMATMPKLCALEKRYGSLALGVLLRKLSSRGNPARPDVFSFSGGMETLVATLASQGGFQLRNNLQVSEIWPVQGGWKACGSDGVTGHSRFVRHLVLCTPADAAASLVNQLDVELARLLAAIEYTPVNIVHTGFDRSKVRHPLDGSGFLVPKDSRFGPNGCLWISSLFPGHAPAGKVLLSNYLGGARNPAVADWDASRCLDSVMHMLRHLLGISADPDLLHIETHARALPLYHGAYSQRLQAIKRRLQDLPGLYLEGNYKGGVSVRDRILCADALARRILQQRARRTQHSSSIQNPGGIQDIAAVTVTPG